MKRILCVLLMLTAFSSAFADNESVPGETLLSNLPEGSRIVVKQQIQMSAKDPDLTSRSDFYTYLSWGAFENVSKLLYGKRVVVLNVDGNTYQSGSVWTTSSANPKSHGTAGIKQIWIPLHNIAGAKYDSNHWGVISFSTIDGALPERVADFDRLVGSYFRIIYDDPGYDPYQGMDKSVAIDLLMAKVTAALKDNRYADALPQFIFLEKRGTALPESFYYYYIDTLEKTGAKDKARDRANDYLKTYGKNGKYYSRVIEIMSHL